MPINMSNTTPIIKVNKLTHENKIDAIIVFFGAIPSTKVEDIGALFKKEPAHKIFDNVFSSYELDYIHKNAVDVIFIDKSIYLDDSIGIVKLKIYEALLNTISIDEMYLFCFKDEPIDIGVLYHSLTQNDKLSLTYNRIEGALMNVHDNELRLFKSNIRQKSTYTFDDIIQLNLTKTKHVVAQSISQKIVLENNYPFVVNPLLVNTLDTLLDKTHNEITTLSNQLLLDTGKIYSHSIYLCTAEQAFKHFENKQLSTEYASKIYFPFLRTINVVDMISLKSNQHHLLQQSSKLLTENTRRLFDNIDLFYDLSSSQTTSENYKQNTKVSGIVDFNLMIHPKRTVKFPLDIVFKHLHASSSCPLIKFNPDTKQENMYRLYTTRRTSDGKKIPELSRSHIFRLMREIGKRPCVAVYTELTYKFRKYNIICEIQNSGIITMYPL